MMEAESEAVDQSAHVLGASVPSMRVAVAATAPDGQSLPPYSSNRMALKSALPANSDASVSNIGLPSIRTQPRAPPRRVVARDVDVDVSATYMVPPASLMPAA